MISSFGSGALSWSVHVGVDEPPVLRRKGDTFRRGGQPRCLQERYSHCNRHRAESVSLAGSRIKVRRAHVPAQRTVNDIVWDWVPPDKSRPPSTELTEEPLPPGGQ